MCFVASCNEVLGSDIVFWNYDIKMMFGNL